MNFKTCLLPVLLLSFTVSSSAQHKLPFEETDNGFRFIDGECVNDSGEPGLNGVFLGQCADFRGTILGRLKLNDIDFSGSDFSSTKLEAVNFQKSTFNNVKFENSILTGVDFIEANLIESNFNRAQVKSVHFAEATIKNSTFVNATLTGLKLNFLKLEGNDFTGAQLVKADLSETEWLDSNLNQANLRESDIQRSTFTNVSMNNTNLSSSNLVNTSFVSVTMNEAILSNSLLTDSLFTEVQGDSVKLKSSNLNRSKLTDVSFKGVDLNHSDLNSSELTRVNLSGCAIRGSDLRSLNIDSSVFDECVYSINTQFDFTDSEIIAMKLMLIPFFGIGLFMNDNYVDVSEGNNGSEASNLQATLKNKEGYVEFSETTGEEFQEILSTKNIIVIPELEGSRLTLSAESVAMQKEFVQRGGTLIVFGDRFTNGISLLNSIFGFTMSIGPNGNGTTFNLNDSDKSTFSETPLSTIVGQDATFTVQTNSLPEGSKSVFVNANDTALAEISVGKGRVIFFAYDWYDAAPVGSVDEGWLSLLDLAVAE